MSAVADLDARLGELTLRDEHRLRGRLRRVERTSDDDARAAELAKLIAEIDKAQARIARRAAGVPARIDYPEQLPVSQRHDELLEAIRDHQVVVVAGETGSGKTTQLPKICLELGRGVRGMIAHTQPRRIAARSVAERIAEELQVPLGEQVGYAVRFNDRSREDTLLRLLTDGLLLAEIQSDRLLRRYDTIIVDEAHERSLNIDFLLGYIKRILPERPDLKLIITSATIDPQRFAAHFGEDVPVIEVSGRTFDVAVRYRPLEREDEDDVDPTDGIADAVDELLRERRGDVLVFLSGEREIRDTADALRGRFGSDLEILPLYARLSSQEQQRVFRGSTGRRVVLATNVAETSLTVPGIRSVVDPGTARISRYSARLKVQRLPIERVSQASADQRKGRCGRVAEGVCIRLYAEADFGERARFTDPEILRTNLASVILQMAAIGLGDIAQFPFLDPPDARQIRDGVNLLSELGALDGDRLTQTGRRLAQLPVDPRLARMVIEANHLACADEVIVIAAALSIQDPRERPQEKQAQADQLHARFKDESSDFVAYLNLWRHLREQQQELSGNQFRKRCQAEFLHYLRVREWQDLVAQLRAAARGADVTINREPAEVPQIHQALLAGLLSHIGVRDERRPREYVGARNARFAIFPGSGLAKKPPAWVMVAELVETSRLWGRVGARIDPKWVEPLAGHLLKRQYSEPRWDRKRAAVVATERVTLYGLPIVAGRSVAYGRTDPALSRDLFLRRGLVEGDWDTRHHFVRDNERMIEEVRALEERARRRDILVDDQVLYDFYAARIPEQIISGAHFDRWWRDERKRDPQLLTFTQELLIAPQAADALDDPGRPSVWRQAGQELQLTYRFDPTSAHDGVTVHVPLRLLGELRPTGFDWLVPSLRPELVTELIRSLPKDVRRQLMPVPDTAAEVVAGLRPRRGPIVDQVAELLGQLRGVQVTGADFATAALPAYLRMTFQVEDEDGTVLGSGQDLAAVRAGLQPRLRAELGAASAGLEQDGLTSWTLGTLPREVSLPGAGNAVKAYPTLVDQGDAVGVRVLDSAGAQAAAMWAGTRRLLLLASPSPLKFVQSRLSPAAQLTLAAAPHHNLAALVEDAASAATDVLLAQAGGPAWDEAGFARLREHVARHLVDETSRVVADVVRVLDARRAADRALEETPITTPQEARIDVATQLGRLVFPGFIAATGAARLPDVVRYLQGAVKRLERLPTQPGPDLDRLRSVHELEALYRARVDGVPRDRPLPAALREVPWMLEELRLSHFAQGVGVKGPVSAKRIRQAIAAPA